MCKRAYLLEQLEERISYFEGESKQHKKLYRNLRYAVFTLTAVSSLLAGLALKFTEANSYFDLAIVFISATIGVVTSIEGLRKPAELWIHERITYYALLDLKREVEFYLNENSPPEVVEHFFRKMQETLGASGEKWNRHIASHTPNPNASSGTNALQVARA